MTTTKKPTFLAKSPVLITEPAHEYDALRDTFEQEIKPQGAVESMYTDDISSIVWEILRLRRAKTAIINAAFREAVVHVLSTCLRTAKNLLPSREQTEPLVLAWFRDKQGKKQVREILNRVGLDDHAIEAEAIRRSCPTLEQLDRMLASLEGRRNRSLRCIGDYRLARRLRATSDRIIEEEKVPQLEHAPSAESAVN